MIPNVISIGLNASIDLINKELSIENYGECVDLLLYYPAACASNAGNSGLTKELL